MCSTRARIRRGGRAYVARCRTNARSGGSCSGTLRWSPLRRDTGLFRLRAMGATIGIGARPDHGTAVRLRLEDGEEAVRPRVDQDVSGVRDGGPCIDGTMFEPTVAF